MAICRVLELFWLAGAALLTVEFVGPCCGAEVQPDGDDELCWARPALEGAAGAPARRVPGRPPGQPALLSTCGMPYTNPAFALAPVHASCAVRHPRLFVLQRRHGTVCALS